MAFDAAVMRSGYFSARCVDITRYWLFREMAEYADNVALGALFDIAINILFTLLGAARTTYMPLASPPLSLRYQSCKKLPSFSDYHCKHLKDERISVMRPGATSRATRAHSQKPRAAAAFTPGTIPRRRHGAFTRQCHFRFTFSG